MNLLEKTALALGRVRAAYDAPLLKSLGVDGLGRTLPLGAATQSLGTAGPVWLGTSGNELAQSGYTNHGTAYSIVSYMLDAAASIPWNVYALDAKDKRATVLPNHPLAALLYRPNPRQSWRAFATQCKGGRYVNGECFIRFVTPAAGSKKGKTAEMWCLVGRVDLLPLTGLGEFDTPTGYRHYDALTGRVTDYAYEEILHIKTYNPLNPHRGLSPIAAGIDAITAGKAGLASRVRQYSNQGPAGVIFDKKANEPWSAGQTKSVRDWINSYFSGGRRFGEVPITGGELGYLQLGLSPVDLDVLAAIPYDKDAIADLFHFPGQLLNGSKGTTFSNMGEAGGALYSRCVIPSETELRDELNRRLGPEYNDEAYLDFDTSHIPELQPNKEKLVAWLSTAYWISVERKQELMGEVVDWDGPKYLVPATLIGAEELGAGAVPDDAATGGVVN